MSSRPHGAREPVPIHSPGQRWLYQQGTATPAAHARGRGAHGPERPASPGRRCGLTPPFTGVGHRKVGLPPLRMRVWRWPGVSTREATWQNLVTRTSSGLHPTKVTRDCKFSQRTQREANLNRERASQRAVRLQGSPSLGAGPSLPFFLFLSSQIKESVKLLTKEKDGNKVV